MNLYFRKENDFKDGKIEYKISTILSCQNFQFLSKGGRGKAAKWIQNENRNSHITDSIVIFYQLLRL